MKYTMNDAYVMRCIDSVYLLIPYKRTTNGTRLFNFNKIGADIIENCAFYESDIELKEHILSKYEKDGLTEETYDNFIGQLISFNILLEE